MDKDNNKGDKDDNKGDEDDDSDIDPVDYLKKKKLDQDPVDYLKKKKLDKDDLKQDFIPPNGDIASTTSTTSSLPPVIHGASQNYLPGIHGAQSPGSQSMLSVMHGAAWNPSCVNKYSNVPVYNSLRLYRFVDFVTASQTINEKDKEIILSAFYDESMKNDVMPYFDCLCSEGKSNEGIFDSLIYLVKILCKRKRERLATKNQDY